MYGRIAVRLHAFSQTEVAGASASRLGHITLKKGPTNIHWIENWRFQSHCERSLLPSQESNLYSSFMQ
jgi:hypothetical protein